MNRPPLNPVARALRRASAFGIGPGVPPVLTPAPDSPEMERMVRPGEPWDTGQLAAIYPDAGAKAQAYLDGAR